MKIAFNPSTVAALIAPPNNKDITFDLRGRNIFARGVKFQGTDTWRDIKINNVSIDSNILDLQNGSNTTLTNTNGVVTINSTWRPVVDNLTSDSTTSSLSANQGRVLAGLINNHQQIIDMRNYDENYWHPVTVPLSFTGYNKIKVSVQLNIGDKPSWATHSSGFTCNMEIWATAHGWGTTNAETICLNYTYGHCNSNPCGWKQLGYPSLGVLFLRGGSRYKVWTDFDATFTPHDKTYTWTKEGYTQSTGGPYTSCPGLNFIKNRIYANLEGSAYYLEGGNIPSWGTLTAANGFTNVSSYDYGSRGAYGLCGKNTALYMQLNGYFYQNEGKYRVIDTSDFNWTNLPGKVVGNEFNIVSAGFNNQLYFNYLPIDNRASSAYISQYVMGNGNKGLASVYAYRFKADGKSCMWKDARNYAPFYSTFNGGFEPILDIKTVSGDWSIGSYDSTGNYLIFSFTSDSDFNAGVNGTAWYYITTDGTFSGASKYINHTPGDPQSYMYSTSTGTYGGAIQIREVNEVLDKQNAWGYAPRITFNWGNRYAKGFGMRSDGQFAVDDIPIALTSNVLTFSNESADYLSANFTNPDFSKKAASKYIECWDETGGWWNFMAGKFMKSGSSDAYVLLGGGGHKPLSEFQLGSGSYLPYKGWWSNGNGLDVNDANGMIFAYANHKNSPFSSAWGIITTFDYTYNSNYKFQLAANGYSNAMYYRSRSKDRGGWTSWAQVIDTGNIGSQTVANAYHLRINSANTWSTWYWQGQSGQPTWLWGGNDGENMYVWNPSNFSVKYATSAGSVAWSNVTGKPTIPNPTNYYWANIKVSASSNTQTKPSVNTIYANNWFRSQGNSGWYSETYGGGIYMTDTSWIRTYNGKGFYCDNQIYSSNSIRMSNICLQNSNEINNNANGALHLNYRNTGNITLCNGGGNVGIGTSSPSYKLDVKGDIRATGQIIREGYGNTWVNGRIVALLRETSVVGYHTLWSLKTTNGSWDFGEHNAGIGWDNVPVLSYITDSNYNSGNNVATYQIKFPLASGTVALTSYGGDAFHPIFLGYLDLEHGNDGTIGSYFFCLGYSVPFTYTRGGDYCKISIPDTTHQVFYIKAAIASVNYSGGGMNNGTGEHRGDGTWWLHCYASGSNEVSVKGFRNSSGDNDGWWGGNPLYSGNGSANVITVCLFGSVYYK